MNYKELNYEIRYTQNKINILENSGYRNNSGNIFSFHAFKNSQKFDLINKFNINKNLDLIKLNLSNFNTNFIEYKLDKIFDYYFKVDLINKEITNDICKQYTLINYYLNIIYKDNIFSFDAQNKFDIFYNFDYILNDIYIKQSLIEKTSNFESLHLSKNKHTIVFSKYCAGIIVHEIVGHLSEVFTLNINWWKKNYNIFNESINIIDDPTLKNMVGSYPFDDEGINSRKKFLVKNGCICEFLNSNLYTDNSELNGSARCENYTTIPKPRMSNTYLEYTKNSLNSFQNLSEYIYIYSIEKGGINYNDQKVYVLGKGILFNGYGKTYNLDKIILSEDLLTFIKNLSCIGDNIYFQNSCWCLKDSQTPIPVKYGSPRLKVDNVHTIQITN